MNERQNKLDRMKQYFLRELAEDQQNGTVFDSQVLDDIDGLKRQFADSPAKDYHRNDEEKELGFHPAGTKGIAGCSTIPCFGGKMPHQSLPVSMCAIGQTMCDESPIQSMREVKKFKEMDAKLKEQKRLERNAKARKRYAARKGRNKSI